MCEVTEMVSAEFSTDNLKKLFRRVQNNWKIIIMFLLPPFSITFVCLYLPRAPSSAALKVTSFRNSE